MQELGEDVQRALEFVLNRSGPDILTFLELVFQFLHQNTDFYHVTSDPVSRGIGFQQGVAEKIVQRAFFKFKSSPNPNLPPADSDKNATSRPTIQTQERNPEPTSSVPDAVCEEVVASASETLTSSQSPMTSSTSGTPDVSSSRDASPPRVQQSGDTFNGGRTDKYCWAQTQNDADIKITLPLNVTNKSQLKVQLTGAKLSVALRSESGNFDEFISGDFFSKVSTEDSCWNFDSKKRELHVFVEKLQPIWWKKLFVQDETELDMSTLDTTTNLHDLPAEEQAVIDRLKYDDLCKKKGLPTSQQQQTQEILRKAWNADGSPFAGTEFDPSRVNIS